MKKRHIKEGTCKVGKSRFQKIGIGISAVFALALIGWQVAYVVVQHKYRIEYLDTSFFYIINALILILIFLAVFNFFKGQSKIQVVCALAFFVLLVFNGQRLYHEKVQIQTNINFSPDHQQVFILKRNRETGETITYRRYYGVFARPDEVLPYYARHTFKFQWLTPDIVTVTYREKNNGVIREHVGTYGDRGSGISYYYVQSALTGIWEGTDSEGEPVTLDYSSGEMNLSTHGESETFEAADNLQFGTIALVLRSGDHAKWTIALNQDCVIGENDLIEDGGTITLSDISLKKTKPVILKRIQ